MTLVGRVYSCVAKINGKIYEYASNEMSKAEFLMIEELERQNILPESVEWLKLEKL